MVNQTVAALEYLAEKERKERSKVMFPTSMKVLGVKAINIKKVVNECWASLQNEAPEKLLQFAKDLVKTRVIECNQVAFLLLWKSKSAMRLIGLKDIEELAQNIDNWVTVDTLSVLISGCVWRENQISDADVLAWLNSENRWWRRTAVVSTVSLNLRSRGGTGDAKRTLLICEKVVNERDDMIVKALSWALRELSKRDKPAVEKFMDSYDLQLAGRVRREVYSKLQTGRKNG
ncbi:DNA alkylation repair protein [uncultured Draconibacterium sp.]|uniref:DNA alkylation repair protein n=1 Tax=uncultured Draconibacterium sp. TaxID=1573823 RepID=UPI003216F8CF